MGGQLRQVEGQPSGRGASPLAPPLVVLVVSPAELPSLLLTAVVLLVVEVVVSLVVEVSLLVSGERALVAEEVASTPFGFPRVQPKHANRRTPPSEAKYSNLILTETEPLKRTAELPISRRS